MNKIPLYVLVAISVASIAMVASSTTNTNTSPGVVGAIVPIMGHVALTVQDDNGMIKHYVESDNAIVNGGEDCLAKLLFANKTAAGVDETGGTECVGAVTNPFTWIALGSDNATPADTDTDLGSQIDALGLEISRGTAVRTSTAAGTVVVITNVFTAGTGVSDVAIQETGLFNSTVADTNGMFARALVDLVSVSADDTLTVEWTITLGN